MMTSSHSTANATTTAVTVIIDAMLPRLLFLLLFAAGFGFTLSSTIGVGYISRLLEIQDRERVPASVQVAAARDVLRRVVPHLYSSFESRSIPKATCDGDFCLIIKNHPFNAQPGAPEILISGVTGVEIVTGLLWYLKYHYGSHISWDKTGGFQTPLLLKSGRLPRVQDAGMVVRRPVPWSYYQNAVTSSYTFAWWDWGRWEKEIDWMALQGINLPLALTGQELIWQKVFLRFNISTALIPSSNRPLAGL